MKITLYFEDLKEASMALDSCKYYSVLHDMYQYLRTNVKHGDERLGDAYDEFNSLLNSEGIDLFRE